MVNASGPLANSATRDLEADLRSVVGGEVRFDAVTRHMYSTDASIYQMDHADLIVADTVGAPNLVVYSHGAGAVVASGQTLEWGYDREQAAGIILANLIPWANDLGPAWLSADPLSGIVPVGGSLNLSVLFDAAGLFGGQYDADILLRSNDPDEQEVVVPVVLNVTGAADISLSAGTLDFGSLFIGLSNNLTLRVTNLGTDVLSVSSAASDNAVFTLDVSSFDLAVGDSRDVIVTFTPVTAVPELGTLTISSNDPDSPVLTVALQGEGLVPPDISVSPSLLSESLFTGGTSTQTLTIDNTGGNDLVWEAEVRGEGSATLEELFTSLESNAGLVTAAIPNRFDFSGGVSGFSISDGGGDMFDGGNFLHTSIGGPLAYTGSQIVSSPAFGSGNRYFTWKGQGLFVLAADMTGVTQFFITGNLGADGGGNADGTVLQTTVDGVSYLGFVKRVYNAGNDPSVNHLIIIEQTPGADHSFSTKYILIARSILQMLRVKANTVLLVFAFLALIPLPPLVITGVVVMIIWSIHKKALAEPPH